MKYKTISIISGLFIGMLLSYGTVSLAQSLWYPVNNQLVPVSNVWGVNASGTSNFSTTSIKNLTVLGVPTIGNVLKASTTAGLVYWGTDATGAGGLVTWVIDGTNMYATSTITRVGINNVSPSSTLHIIGSLELAGTSTFWNNLSFSTTGDAYIYFNAGAEYMLWDDGGGNFFFSDDITTNNVITGSNISLASSTIWDAAKYLTPASSTLWSIGSVNAGFISAASSSLWSATYGIVNASSSPKWDLTYGIVNSALTMASSSLWSSAYSIVNANLTAASSTKWSIATKNTASINLINATGTLETMFKKQNAITLTKVSCNSQNGTTSIQLYERTEATPNSAGTALLNAILVCGDSSATTASTTSFADSAIASSAPVIASSTTGTAGAANTATFIYIDYSF